MICIRCDASDFEERNEIITQDFGSEILRVECPASVCRMCGWVTVSPSQADELFKRTLTAYAQERANQERKPKPEIGRVYKSKCTGSLATLTRIFSDGVMMKHRTKSHKQNWRTFFTYWKPL